METGATTTATTTPRAESPEDDIMRQAALQDVYGTCAVKNFDHGEAMLGSARQQLEDALRMLPQHEGGETTDRRAYDEAMQKCPHLVEMESNAAAFLRALDYDPWATAQRIALYWKWRKDIFGERAFLPMRLTVTKTGQEGALSAEDAQAFQCGGTCILPPDQNRRPILFVDRERSCSRCLEDTGLRLRLIFYMLQVLFESDLGQKHGMVGIHAFSSKPEQPSSTKSSKTGSSTDKRKQKVIELFGSGAIPVKIKACHVLVFKKRSILDSCVRPWLSLHEQLGILPLRMIVHFAESKLQVLNELRQYGFLETQLPTEMGGSLDCAFEFERWRMDRIRSEQKRYAVGSAIPNVASESGNLNGRTEENSSDSNLGVLSHAVKRAREEEAKTRHRKICRLYQQKKREQFKQEKDHLECQVKEKERERTGLEREHQRLLSLLEQADNFVKDQRHHATWLHQQPPQKPAAVPVPPPRPSAASPIGPNHQFPGNDLSGLLTQKLQGALAGQNNIDNNDNMGATGRPSQSSTKTTTTTTTTMTSASLTTTSQGNHDPVVVDPSSLVEQLQQERMQNALLVQLIERLATENVQLERRQSVLDQRIEVLFQQQQQQIQQQQQQQDWPHQQLMRTLFGGGVGGGDQQQVAPGTTAALAAAASGALSGLTAARHAMPQQQQQRLPLQQQQQQLQHESNPQQPLSVSERLQTPGNIRAFLSAQQQQRHSHHHPPTQRQQPPGVNGAWAT